MNHPRSANVPVRVSLAEESSGANIPTVHQHKSLKSAGISLEDNRYVLAINDSGRIVGVVSRDRILNRLQASNDTERSRWSEMPVGALMNVAFTDTGEPRAQLSDNLEAVAITENGGIVGVAIEDDVFLSWDRLEPLLTTAITDPLTGLMNRLAYERRLNEEWYRAIRTGTSVGVLVADLDGLKPVNDTHGHQAGDTVLRGVASLLEHSLRSYDILARYGGDEFVALCIGCRPGEIGIPIRRIQRRIENAEFRHQGMPLDVSLSIGAAVRHTGFADGSPRDLFRSADECMYLAKGSPHQGFVMEFGDNPSPTPEPVDLSASLTTFPGVS